MDYIQHAAARKQRTTENNKEMDLSKLTSLYSESGVYPNIPNLIRENDGYYPSQVHKVYGVADFEFDFLKDFESVWELLQNVEEEDKSQNSQDDGEMTLSNFGEHEVESFLGLPIGFSPLSYNVPDGNCKLMRNNLITLLVKNTKSGPNLTTTFSVYYNLKNRESVAEMVRVLECFYKKRKGRDEKPQPKMNLVCANAYGFHKRPFNMRDNCNLSKDLLKLHYGDGIAEIEDKILDLLSRDEPSLVLFSGEPGTGKTSFIRHLVSVLENQKFLYMPPNIANELGSPHFLPFMLQNPGEICVLEDAELALMARDDGNHSSAISNLLGASDGLLGDALKLKFVCSFNTDLKNIDTALVRKGRLGHLQDFKKLSKENSDRLLEHLGKDRLGKELSLAEIYNQDDNGFKKKENKKVGFGFH
jgi:hypothetical protein